MAGSSRGLAWAAGVAVTVVWGASFAVTRVAVMDVPPLTLALLRFAVGVALLWPLLRRRLAASPLLPADRGAVVWLGLTGVTFAFLFENLGLRLTTASHGALIVATTPLATALAEAVAERRAPRPRVVAGLLTGLAGVTVLVAEGGGGASLAGDLLMVGTVVTWVAYSFLARRLTAAYEPVLVTFRSLVAGTLALVPLAAVELLAGPAPRFGAGSVAAILYLGVVCSALAYVAWNHTLSVLGVTATNSLIYGIPVVGVACGVALLGEPAGWQTLFGAALVLAGLLLANLGRAALRPVLDRLRRPLRPIP